MKSSDEKAEERAAWHRITGSPDCEFIRRWLKEELENISLTLFKENLPDTSVDILRGRGAQINLTLQKFEQPPVPEE